ncbi:MAG: sensor domain-containing protein, partial [Gammaproteobacteria bacterium]
DALYDAEEYLRNELHENPGKTETELLAGIATTYGIPEEVADAYRQTEKTVQAALRTPRPRPRKSALGRFFGVMGDPNAWTAMLFLLLGLPVGIFLFTWAVTGLALSVGFAIMIIGVPFFLLFLASVRLFALVEGRFVEVLLGVRMPRRPLHPGQPKSFFRRIMDMLKDGRTWSTILYMLLKLPLGIAGYVIVVVGVAVPLGFIVAPIVQYGFDEPNIWINGPIYLPWYGEAGMVIVGILLLITMMHVFRWVGIAQAHVARALLVKTAEAVSDNGG